MAACKGDASILIEICRVFRASLPGQLEGLRVAIQDKDWIQLREAARRLCGTIGAFSTKAGEVASAIEDFGEEGLIDEAMPLVERFEAMARVLMTALNHLSLESLLQLLRTTGG